MIKICTVCGKEFETKCETAKYCSKKCCNKIYTQTEVYKKIKANRNTNLDYRIKDKYRSAIKSVAKRKNFRSKCWDVLPYTPAVLKEHLESQFRDGMDWSNHGTLWHIDHIRPLASYTFVDEQGNIYYETIKEANGLHNLRPVLIDENLHKSSYYDGVHYKKSYKS